MKLLDRSISLTGAISPEQSTRKFWQEQCSPRPGERRPHHEFTSDWR